MELHFDEAFEFLIERLATVPEQHGRAAQIARNNTYGCDIWVPHIVQS
jgi:hypothetical protein